MNLLAFHCNSLTFDSKFYSFIYYLFNIYLIISSLVKIPFWFNFFQRMRATHYLSDKTRLNHFLHIHIVFKNFSSKGKSHLDPPLQLMKYLIEEY